MTDGSGTTDLLRTLTCPVCSHHVAIALFNSGAGLDVVRCVDCGHAFNAGRDRADAVPHADRPTRALRGAPGWQDHVRAVRDETLGRLNGAPVVMEVGHGDGAFLAALAESRPKGRYVGFDPEGIADAPHPAVDLRPEPFLALRALAEVTPDLIVVRYVMEYLTHPLGFLQQLAFAAAWSGIQPMVFVEVPCIDRALETGRTFDFDRALTSYFTTASFMRMLSRCGVVEQRIGHGHQKDVLYAFVRLGRGQPQIQHARAAEAFRSTARESLGRLRRQLDGLAAAGRSVAIWGGTGEAAAFIAQVGADALRFPVVIDADEEAIGTRVPGTGQEIRPPAWLRDHPADVVIIPAARRARDIVREMSVLDIRCDTVLVEDRGRLIDYVPATREPLARDAADRLPALASR
jgi:hypothetical protein